MSEVFIRLFGFAVFLLQEPVSAGIDLKKEKERQESWTSRLMKKINEHKFITMIVAIIIACTMTNFFLIYRFIHIIEKI